MLQLNRILHQRDADAMRRLVSPTSGLSVRAGFSDGESSSEASEMVMAADSMEEVFDTIQPFQLFHDDMTCAEQFGKDGSAECVALGGGFRGVYVWQRNGTDVHLVSVDQQSH